MSTQHTDMNSARRSLACTVYIYTQSYIIVRQDNETSRCVRITSFFSPEMTRKSRDQSSHQARMKLFW